MNHLVFLKEYLEIRCRIELDGETEEDAARIQEINNFFLEQNKPLKFNPYEPDNVLMRNEIQFEELIAVLEDSGVVNAKRLTEFEFYNRLRFYEKKFKVNAGK